MEIYNSVRPDPAGMGGERRGGDTVLILGSVKSRAQTPAIAQQQ